MRTNHHQCDEAEQRHTHCAEQIKANPAKSKKAKEIKWNEWWPFDRATGDALKQLNRKQRKHNVADDFEDAPL